MSSFQPIVGLASSYAVSKSKTEPKDTAQKHEGCIKTKTRNGPCVSPDPRKFFPEDKKQRSPVEPKNGSSAGSDVQPEKVDPTR